MMWSIECIIFYGVLIIFIFPKSNLHLLGSLCVFKKGHYEGFIFLKGKKNLSKTSSTKGYNLA